MGQVTTPGKDKSDSGGKTESLENTDKRPNTLDNIETIHKKTPKSNGIYVKGSIYGIPIWFTTDTGASRTVVSTRVYNKINTKNRPTLQSHHHIALEQADGASLDMEGTVLISMNLGEITLEKEVIIADIKDDVLVGMDIGNKVDIITSQRKIVIDDQEIPYAHVQRRQLYKVTSADTYIIKGETEHEISVYVEDIQQEEWLG